MKGTIQVLRQQRGGWGQKMAILADLHTDVILEWSLIKM